VAPANVEWLRIEIKTKMVRPDAPDLDFPQNVITTFPKHPGTPTASKSNRPGTQHKGPACYHDTYFKFGAWGNSRFRKQAQIALASPCGDQMFDQRLVFSLMQFVDLFLKDAIGAGYPFVMAQMFYP